MTSGFAQLPFVLLLAGLGCSSPPPKEPGSATQTVRRPAILGVTTSVPSEGLTEELGLTTDVRVQGRVIEEVEPRGPAARAGLRTGDVLLRLDENELYSADDISDFLAVSTPGRQVAVQFKRGDPELRRTAVVLGEADSVVDSGPRLTWQFASLAQLPAALEVARAKKKKVMVGLTGAET